MTSSLTPGEAVEIGAGVRRLLAPNAGPMTGPGTNTYLVGNADVAVIDPGPPIDKHIDAIEHAGEGRIRWILVTHTHPDHSPAAAKLAARTGAKLLGQPPPQGKLQDQTFVPDRILADGDELSSDEFCLQAVHTPGHASNHVCYRHEALSWLFTGDHIMNGSTVVIDPPDGDMKDYLESLEKLKSLTLKALAPGHGHVMDNPMDAVDWLINHRLKRESKLVTCLAEHPDLSVNQLVTFVYDDVSVGLHRLALRSLHAHLLKLQKENRADLNDDLWHLTRRNSDSNEPGNL
jgi:glyoxylase-like metal-dependent hydrolase (beta-lactamase superfamily II)